MKYIREISDIHLDVDVRRWNGTRKYNLNEPNRGNLSLLWFPEPMEGDKDTCLIIAGDLWIQRKFLTRLFDDTQKSWLATVAEQFKYVVFVLGNHDYWDVSLNLEPNKVRDEISEQGLENVYFLEKDIVVLDQVKFVGGTLWTDFNRHDPLVMFQAPNIMNDYKYMRYGKDYGKCYPNHVYEIFMNTKNFIFENAKKDNPDQTLIVVTHMAPSIQSVHEMYRQTVADTIPNYFYYSNLEQRIFQDGEDIDFWFHGHMHNVSDYVLEPKCRVICNPRGYAGHEQTDFDPFLRFELNERAA